MRFNEFQKGLLAEGLLPEPVEAMQHPDVRSTMVVNIGAQLEHLAGEAELCGLNLDDIATFWLQHAKDAK